MKKTVRGLMITGIILMVIGIVMFGVTPKIMTAASGGTNPLGFGVMDLIHSFVPSFLGLFSTFGPATWYFIGTAGVVVLMFIINLIVIIAKKRPGGLWVAFLFLIFGAALSAGVVLLFTPDYVKGASDGWCPLICHILEKVKVNENPANVWWLVLIFAELGIAALGFIFIFIATIVNMVYLGRSPKPLKGARAKDAKNADVVVIRDDAVNGPAPTSEEIRQIMHDEMNQSSVKPAAAESEFKGRSTSSAESAQAIGGGATAITGPLLVQYINTYSPEPHGPVPTDRRSSVPLSEIKENVTGEKSLKAEDIRKIIKEELDSQKKEAASQPLIVTVPAPSSEEGTEEKPSSLTADDIRAIIADEFKSHFAESEKENDVDEDIVVEPVPEPELSADDIRSIIREELAADKKAADEEEAAKKAEEEKRIAAENERKELEARHQKELEEARAQAAEAARKAIEEEAARKAAEEEAARKAAEEERKNTLTADQVRQIIVEELSRKEEEKPSPAPASTPAPLSADDIRAIIADELKSVKNVSDKPATPVTIIVREPLDRKEAAPAVEEKKPEPVKEEPKPIPAPVKEEPKPEPVKEPEPTPEPVVEETPVEEEEAPASEEDSGKRTVGQVNPNLPPHEKIIRIPFQTRMAEVDDELKSRYNELKSEIMSYGVKSRVSNSGDTFRLHKVTFVKMTIAGKGLKLYMALDPKDYANTTLPIQDAGHKGTYKDIPLVFKVKSDLSMRRAKQLIADVMNKNGLTQGEVEKRDWIAEMGDASSDSDED